MFIITNKKFSIIYTFIMIFIIGASFVSTVQNKTTPISSFSVQADIIIDAGHGDFDGGTQASDGTLEKDLNLQLALKIRDALVSKGYSVAMVRETDVALDTSGKKTIRERKRADLAYRKSLVQSNPKLFLSIHMNAFSDPQYGGAQVFTNQSAELQGKLLQTALREKIDPTNKREIKKIDSSVFIFKGATSPCILLECGFLSNSTDFNNLKNNEYQEKFAAVVAESIKLQ